MDKVRVILEIKVISNLDMHIDQLYKMKDSSSVFVDDLITELTQERDIMVQNLIEAIKKDNV